MIKVPADLHFAEADSDAIAQARLLRNSDSSWGNLIAVAQRTIGQYQRLANMQDEEVDALHDEESALPLVSAARILDSAFRVLENRNSDTANEVGLLACAAYAMYGNFTSAAAIANSLISYFDNYSNSEKICLSIFCPRLSEKIKDSIDSGSLEESEFFEDLILFLETGYIATDTHLPSQLKRCYKTAQSPTDIIIFQCARVALRQLVSLSSARIMSQHADVFPLRLSANLLRDGIFTFLPPQKKAIVEWGVCSDRGNMLLALPTSTGKTLIGELALFSALKDGPGLACFICPYVALGQQVGAALRRHAPKGYQVHTHVGGFRSEQPLNPTRFREIVVATPERFDGLLRSLKDYKQLKMVIVDEAHLIENGGRGARLECILARLRLIQEQFKKLRIILLSAVVGDVSALTEWLSIPEYNIKKERWRPTARRIGIWSQDNVLKWIYGNDPLRPKSKSAMDTIGSILLKAPNRLRPADKFSVVKARLPDAYMNVAVLATKLHSMLGGPILLVCMTKAGSRGLANAITQLQRSDTVTEMSIAAAETIASKAPFLRSLSEMCKHRVAYHNSTLPLLVRSIIEESVKDGSVQFVCSTTTLAEGVDLPFRATVLFDWLMWNGSKQEPISPLLFRNIVGRCGRAGTFSEGDTIIFENVLGSLKHTADDKRKISFGTIFDEPKNISSAYTGDSIEEGCTAVLESQFLAAIAENETCDDLVSVFFENLYAHWLGREKGIKKVLLNVQNDLLDQDGHGAFATMNSPLRLTPLGVAANATGFSPSSCRDILETLDALVETDSEVSILNFLLENLGSLREQSNYAFKDIVYSGKKVLYTRKSDISYLIDAWIQGYPIDQIFSSLPETTKYKGAVPLPLWLSGGEQSDWWSDVFDKFTEMLQSAFGNYLPWLVSACDKLSPFSSNNLAQINWKNLEATLDKCRDPSLERE